MVLAFFMISLLDDIGALLALFCTGCATSGDQVCAYLRPYHPSSLSQLFCQTLADNQEWIKPICSAVPFEPQDVLDQLQQAFHFTSTSLFL